MTAALLYKCVRHNYKPLIFHIMKINDIIKKGEVLDAEQLAKVTGGAGVIVTNTDCPTNKNCPTNENCPTNAPCSSNIASVCKDPGVEDNHEGCVVVRPINSGCGTNNNNNFMTCTC